MTLQATVGSLPWMRMKGRAGGGGRPFLEAVQNKLELFRRDKRWHLIDRTVNRRANTYDERIVDQGSDVVVREVHQPLSEHCGHGSARGDRT